MYSFWWATLMWYLTLPFPIEPYQEGRKSVFVDRFRLLWQERDKTGSVRVVPRTKGRWADTRARGMAMTKLPVRSKAIAR